MKIATDFEAQPPRSTLQAVLDPIRTVDQGFQRQNRQKSIPKIDESAKSGYVLVWKLRAPLSPGDLVVFSDPEYPHRTGRVKGANSEGYEIERSGGEEVLLIPAQKITGKVISVLWRASRGE